MNTFLENLKDDFSYDYTMNGALTRNTTKSRVLDLFALGGSYRSQTDEDKIALFLKAFQEDSELALKCLFYLRDCRGGAGERDFFRVVFRYLCDKKPDLAKYLFPLIPIYGRWDDIIYSAIDTEINGVVCQYLYMRFSADLVSDEPSLLGKWLPSINASSPETRELAKKLINNWGVTNKFYRQGCSELRKKLDVLERKLSKNEWEKIEYDKISSLAGLKYSEAFNRHDRERYIDFIQNKNTKVNAEVLTPFDVVRKYFNDRDCDPEIIDKYWNNLKDYYNGKEENAIAIVDVSGSMTVNNSTPLFAAIGLGLYVATKSKGDFANHFITFSAKPQLVEILPEAPISENIEFMYRADWGWNTDIEAVFDLLLKTAKAKGTKKEDMPKRLYIFSDMEFDAATDLDELERETLFEYLEKKWKIEGYELPEVVFWNLNARLNIPAIGKKFSYISGFSPSMIENILSGKTGYDLMLDKLLSDRYNLI